MLLKRQPRKAGGVSFPMPEILAGEHGVSAISWITIMIGLISMSNA